VLIENTLKSGIFPKDKTAYWLKKGRKLTYELDRMLGWSKMDTLLKFVTHSCRFGLHEILAHKIKHERTYSVITFKTHVQ
jgi:hypothetical protein